MASKLTNKEILAGSLLLILGAVVLYAVSLFSCAGALWLAWNIALPTLWPAAPHMSYWGAFSLMVGVTIVSTIIRGIFK